MSDFVLAVQPTPMIYETPYPPWKNPVVITKWVFSKDGYGRIVVDKQIVIKKFGRKTRCP